MKDDKDFDLPGDDDENVGDGAPKKRKEKRKKTSEERLAERKTIFWTLLVVLIVTLLFWLIPVMKKGELKMPSFQLKKTNINLTKPEWKGYVEYKLE